MIRQPVLSAGHLAASGNFDITVNAANGVTPDAVQTFTIHVIDPITLPASVVAYWKLDETAGNTFSDLTGVNNGTGNLSPTPSAGQVSGAQLFDGSTTKIDVPADTSLDFTAAGNFSVEFWYKGSTLFLLLLNVAVSRVYPVLHIGGLVLLVELEKHIFQCI